MKNIVLFFIFDDSVAYKYENLGLEIVNQCLNKAGYNSKLIYKNISDYKNFTQSNIDDFVKEIIDYNPSIVGSPVYPPSIKLIDLISKTLKKKKNITFFSGGAMASQSPREVLNFTKYLDFLVIGEGEETSVKLCDAIFNQEPITNVKSIAYKQNNQVVINNSCNEVDLNKYLIIDREIFKDKSVKMARINTSRGCMGHCTFCAESRTFNKNINNRWKGKNPYNVVQEMKMINEKYGIKLFSIIDNSFEDPTPGNGKERLNKICDLIISEKLDFHYTIYLRAESFSAKEISDINLLSKLKKSGLLHIFIGVESGNDPTLKLFGKNANVEDNLETLKLLNQMGFNLEMGFIMFNPYTDYQELYNNLSFLHNVKFCADKFSIYTNRLYLYHNVPLYQKLLKDNLINEEFSITNPLGYNFINSDIQDLVNTLSKINNNRFEFLWNYLRDVSNMNSLFSESNYDYYDVLLEETNKTKLELSEMHLNFFEKYLDISKKGLSHCGIFECFENLYNDTVYNNLYDNIKYHANKFLFFNRKKKIYKIAF